RAIGSSASHSSPSFLNTVNVIDGSRASKAAFATSRPATTHTRRARNMPPTLTRFGTMLSLVTSPSPTSSASASRTSSRYVFGSSGSGMGLNRLDGHGDRVSILQRGRRHDVVAGQHVLRDRIPRLPVRRWKCDRRAHRDAEPQL